MISTVHRVHTLHNDLSRYFWQKTGTAYQLQTKKNINKHSKLCYPLWWRGLARRQGVAVGGCGRWRCNWPQLDSLSELLVVSFLNAVVVIRLQRREDRRSVPATDTHEECGQKQQPWCMLSHYHPKNPPPPTPPGNQTRCIHLFHPLLPNSPRLSLLTLDK